MISHVAAVNLFAEMHDSRANRALHRHGRVRGVSAPLLRRHGDSYAVQGYSLKPADDFIRQAGANGLHVSILRENSGALFTIIGD